MLFLAYIVCLLGGSSENNGFKKSNLKKQIFRIMETLTYLFKHKSFYFSKV